MKIIYDSEKPAHRRVECELADGQIVVAPCYDLSVTLIDGSSAHFSRGKNKETRRGVIEAVKEALEKERSERK